MNKKSLALICVFIFNCVVTIAYAEDYMVGEKSLNELMQMNEGPFYEYLKIQTLQDRRISNQSMSRIFLETALPKTKLYNLVQTTRSKSQKIEQCVRNSSEQIEQLTQRLVNVPTAPITTSFSAQLAVLKSEGDNMKADMVNGINSAIQQMRDYCVRF